MLPLFILNGRVIKGKNRGKALGFPTANIPADKTLLKGTYIAYTELDGKKHPSIVFIGTADTFDEKDFIAESYILDFDKDIYGQDITIEVLQKIRDNQKFESVKELIKQMEEDERKTRAFFENTKQ